MVCTLHAWMPKPRHEAVRALFALGAMFRVSSLATMIAGFDNAS